MCMFSLPVEHVSNTSIFARCLPDGSQALVYSMTYAAAEELAMVLPLPVPPGSAEDAVRFVDLSRYPKFFQDMKKGFPTRYAPAPRSKGLMSLGAPPQQTLAVHDVGDFEASFVPTLADFGRLDARFQLPDEVWAQAPTWSDYGFAVFKLKSSAARVGFFARLLGRSGPTSPRSVHPMAFVFPSRSPGTLFFPTVHVHDGEIHEEAVFDHTLYCQFASERGSQQLLGWEVSAEPAWTFMDAHMSEGLVEPASRCCRRFLEGTLPNRDTWVTGEGRIQG